MLFSTLPFLLLAEVTFVFVLGARSSQPGRVTVALFVFALGIWGSVSTWMVLTGIYDSPGFLALMPGLWLPAVPFAIIGLCLLLPIARRGVRDIAELTPLHWFVAVQALRIAALGTLIKTLRGAFPLESELAVGINDLAFGLSAPWLLKAARRQQISPDALALWHVVGMAIVLLPGGITIQTGLPGPLQAFTKPPTAEVMLDWPLVLAPNLVVPIFLLLNLLGAFASRCQKYPSTREGLQLLKWPPKTGRPQA